MNSTAVMSLFEVRQVMLPYELHKQQVNVVTELFKMGRMT